MKRTLPSAGNCPGFNYNTRSNHKQSKLKINLQNVERKEAIQSNIWNKDGGSRPDSLMRNAMVMECDLFGNVL